MFGQTDLQLAVHLVLGHSLLLGQHVPHRLVEGCQCCLLIGGRFLQFALHAVYLKYSFVSLLDLPIQQAQLGSQVRLFHVPLLLRRYVVAIFVDLEAEAADQTVMLGAVELHHLVVVFADALHQVMERLAQLVET